MSIAQTVVRYIQTHPSVKECLRLGLINHSALARHICKETKSKGAAAAIMASRRYARRIHAQHSSDREIQQVVKGAKVLVKTNLLIAALDSNVDSKRMASIQAKIKDSGGELTLIEGYRMLTLTTSAEYGPMIRQAFGAKVRLYLTGIAQIMLLLSKKSMFTPGFSAFVLSQLASRGINVVEEYTCSGEHLLLLEERDLPEALAALRFEQAPEAEGLKSSHK